MTTWLEQGLRNGRLLQHQVEATADFSAGHFEEEEEKMEEEDKKASAAGLLMLLQPRAGTCRTGLLQCQAFTTSGPVFDPAFIIFKNCNAQSL